MSLLFSRVCELTVDALRLVGLRVSFKVDASTSSKPNVADITVYGLSAESRAIIGLRGQQVRLVAGYPDTAAVIFAGQLMHAQHQRQDDGWQSQIQARDGHPQWKARIGKSFAKGVPHTQLIAELAAEMGLPALTKAQLAAIGSSTTRGPTVLSGYCHQEMTVLANTLGLDWSIQDGTLQLVAADVGTTTETAVVLSPQTGLVGPPDAGTFHNKIPGSKGKTHPPRVKAKSLLQPLLRPGRRVELQSASFSGHYRCDKVTHSGDTHGGEWYSDCELAEVR